MESIAFVVAIRSFFVTVQQHDRADPAFIIKEIFLVNYRHIHLAKTEKHKLITNET
jgi:hypothetical protein